MDRSLPGSSAHGIFQARVLEWGAIAFFGLMAQLCPTLDRDPMDCGLPGFCLRDFPGSNSGVGCHFLLQGIFPTQISGKPGSANREGVFTLQKPREWIFPETFPGARHFIHCDT